MTAIEMHVITACALWMVLRPHVRDILNWLERPHHWWKQ